MQMATNKLATKYTVIVFIIIHAVYGGLPVSYPGIPNSVTGGKRVPYNMIDAYPSCYARGVCPMFPPGGRLSAFPNSEEKVQHTMHNLFRMWGNFTIDLKYGKWKYAANEFGGLTKYCTNCKYCGDTHINRKPLYWYSDANQMARFKQYDEHVCDQAWYSEPGNNAHVTCAWVLDEYDGGSNCDLFGGDCGFGARGRGYCFEDRCWFETEGICGANTCVTDAHCEPIFANKYDYQGTGFYEGMNGATTVYSRFTKEIYYLLPSGAHFDERLKLVEEDRDPDGKYLTLMLEYFDANRTQKPIKCWSLYDETAHEMQVIVSDDWISGDGENRVFGIDAYSVMFSTNHPPPTQCEAYAFICKTTSNNFFRLPQDSSYYLGTEWMDWVWSDYASYGDGYLCKENHYYFDENEGLWIVNGGPNVSRNDIWYYKDTDNYGECIGCSKIATLDCIALCIVSDYTDCDGCEDVIGQTEPPLLTVDDSDGDEEIDNNTNGIIGGVLLGLVCCIFIMLYCYYIRKTEQSICPSLVGVTMAPKQKPSIITTKEYESKGIKVKKIGETPSTTVSSIIASFNNGEINRNNDENEGVVQQCSQLCNECQQNKNCDDGQMDENDGLWYCTECWAQFIE